MTDTNDGARSHEDAAKNNKTSSVESSKVQDDIIIDSLLQPVNICEIVPANQTHSSQPPSQRKEKERRCLCGSTSHFRRSSKHCPLNKKIKDENINAHSALEMSLLMMKSCIRNKTGACSLREKCKFPTLELRVEHKCPKCFQIVHPLCGKFDTKTDKYHCPGCIDSEKPTTNLQCVFIDKDNHEFQREANLVTNITKETTETTEMNEVGDNADLLFEIINGTGTDSVEF